MDISIFTESSISDSYIYGMFNTSGEIQTKLVAGLRSGRLIPAEFLKEQLLQFEKNRFSPLFQKILYAYKEGIIRLLYVPDIKITKSLPFIIHKDGSKIVSTIFISTFAKVDFDVKICDIEAKTLYILMEAAYIGRELQASSAPIKRNTTFMKICNDIYTTMAMRILNRDYALSIDVTLHDKASFCISRFFLERIWENTNPDIVFKYAVSTTTEKRQESFVEINSAYSDAHISDISGLFAFMQESLPARLEKLSVRFFVERYINMYGGAAILSIDYLPYLIFVISCIVIGGYIVNQASLNDIVKNQKEIRRYYSELTKLV